MSDQLALLAAIRDNPDDDTPRLVYADWLDENATSDADHARAEFIRVQIEARQLLIRRGWGQAGAREKELEQREQELLAGFRDIWLGDLPKSFRKVAQFDRGFVDAFDLTPVTCRAKTPPRWNRELDVSVTLRGPAAELEGIIVRGWLDGIRVGSLSIHADRSEPATTALATALASASCAAQLRTLTFHAPDLSDAGVIALTKSVGFRNLRTLSLGGRLTADGWAALADSPIVERLESLTLGKGTYGSPTLEVGPEGAAVLAGSPRLGGLKRLELESSPIGSSGLRTLLTSSHLEALQHLAVHADTFDADAGEAFTAADPPHLEQLALRSCHLPDEALSGFAASRLAHRLRHLELRFNPITAAGAKAFAEGGPYSQLESLSLWGCSIGDEGLKALSRSEAFPALRHLSLTHLGLTDTGASRTLNACWAEQLTTLSISDGISRWMADQLRARFRDVLRVHSW